MSGNRTNAYQNCACTASISERICRLNRVTSGEGMHLQKTVLHRTLLGLSIKSQLAKDIAWLESMENAWSQWR
jgi:hypothetical protein